MAVSIVPQWTAKMYPGKRGRDHLGLGSVSINQILPSLSPGINVLTYHPRYFSFYVFLLDEFWQRDLPRSSKAWKEFFRPREYIFSIGAHLPEHAASRPEHADLGHVVGANITEGHARSDRTHFDPQTYYIKSPFGGYGLYYRTVMAELGLIYPGGRGLPYPVDVPTEKGKEAAGAFRAAVAQTTYYRHYFDDSDKPVPRDVIHAYIDRACLCQLEAADAPDGGIIRKAFLGGGDPREADARLETFRFLLDLLEQTNGFTLQQEAFRQLIFFQEAENGAVYQPREDVLETYSRWRLYQVREYYSFALNSLWNYLCDWGVANHGDYHPLPLTHYWAHLETALDFDQLAEQCALPPPGLTSHSSFTSLLGWLDDVLHNPTPSLDAPFEFNLPLQEHKLYQLAANHRRQPWAMVSGMVVMLALVQVRFGEPALWTEPAWRISRMGTDGRRSVDRYLRTLNEILAGGDVSIMEVTQWLYRRYIILQHQAIASRKLPDNTFRFRREGSLLRFYPLPNALRFMNSRFDALTTTIQELGLCANVREAQHPLTEDGRMLLELGDL